MTSIASGRAAGVAAGVQWSLLFGNFVIGFGVMSVAGTLPDLARSLNVSVAVAGQLMAIAAAVMCFGAPLMAGVVAGWDRRRLLALALLWYAVGHALSVLTDSYALLLVVRTITMLAAVFTPQAAAAVNTIAPPAERGRALTFVLLGWSLASVLGMPMAAWLGGRFGWQAAFGLVSLLCWPLVGSVWTAAVVLVPWALGAFATNSAQQARLAMAMPALAPALMALNSSSIYLGQAIGAGGGGWLIARIGYAALSWVSVAWIALAIGLSFWAARRPARTAVSAVG